MQNCFYNPNVELTHSRYRLFTITRRRPLGLPPGSLQSAQCACFCGWRTWRRGHRHATQPRTRPGLRPQPSPKHKSSDQDLPAPPPQRCRKSFKFDSVASLVERCHFLSHSALVMTRSHVFKRSDIWKNTIPLWCAISAERRTQGNNRTGAWPPAANHPPTQK